MAKQILHILFLLALVCGPGLVFGQQQAADEAELHTASSLFQREFRENRNHTHNLQLGGSNELDIRQYQIGSIGNSIHTEQRGWRNEITALQSGSANQAHIVQNGNRNTAALVMSGEHNKALILQEGHRNTIRQEIINSERITTQYIQQGNDNAILHRVNGDIQNEYKLVQKGNGQRAILLQQGGR